MKLDFTDYPYGLITSAHDLIEALSGLRSDPGAVEADGFWRRADVPDYAVQKRKALHDAGFPAGCARLAVVQSQGHKDTAVIVTTDRGEMVLCHAYGSPTSREEFEADGWAVVLIETAGTWASVAG